MNACLYKMSGHLSAFKFWPTVSNYNFKFSSSEIDDKIQLLDFIPMLEKSAHLNSKLYLINYYLFAATEKTSRKRDEHP